MITVRASANKADVFGFLTKGYGLKAFTAFTYVTGTSVYYKDKLLQFNLSADLGSITYHYSKRTWLGTYELTIRFYVSGTSDSARVSVDVKGKNKPGFPRVEEVTRSFNESKFVEALSLYQRLYGVRALRQELMTRDKALSLIRSLSSKGGKYRLTLSDYSKNVEVVIDDGKVTEVGGSVNDLRGDILVVGMGETTREVAI